MPIQFFDTFEGKIRDFIPLDPKGKEVKIYTCGPTVYDYAHIGNFRAFVFEDLLRRFLEFKGYKVKHVMNITDVDDKTIAGAKREGKRLEEFTATYMEAFHEDLKTLNTLPANYPAEPPRATREISAMIELIEKLIKKGMAYASDGSVYYRVASFSNYGKLSKKKLEGNIKGARVDVDEYDKEEGADFALWKKSKEGEPSWDSPWGKGRPGWHIECSAMSMKYLGETFDIHAGGEDLIFPHHENEIAQSEAATGKKFVNYWLHCKHLLVDGKKMSKKEGNFHTLRDLCAKGFDPTAIRYLLMSAHYRQSLNFTIKGLLEIGVVVEKLRECYFNCYSLKNYFGTVPAVKIEDLKFYSFENFDEELTGKLNTMAENLADDLNISAALANLFDTITLINTGLFNRLMNEERLDNVINFFRQVDDLLGLAITKQEPIPSDILRIRNMRDSIRRNPNFKNDKSLQQQSDNLRREAEKQGWVIQDSRPGESSTIKRKRKS